GGSPPERDGRGPWRSLHGAGVTGRTQGRGEERENIHSGGSSGRWGRGTCCKARAGEGKGTPKRGDPPAGQGARSILSVPLPVETPGPLTSTPRVPARVPPSTRASPGPFFWPPVPSSGPRSLLLAPGPFFWLRTPFFRGPCRSSG